jgi:SAM-dependent methyltransferase
MGISSAPVIFSQGLDGIAVKAQDTLALVAYGLIWLLAELAIIGFVLFAVCLVEGMFLGVSFVPVRKAALLKMIELAGIQEKDVVFDLGSGDGRVVFAAAEKSRQVVGVEGSIVMFLWALIRKRVLNKKGAFIRGNFLDQDLRNADVIFCFLDVKPMDALDRKFRDELKEGCRIISLTFPLKGWQPEEIFCVDDRIKVLPPTVYFYKFHKHLSQPTGERT